MQRGTAIAESSKLQTCVSLAITEEGASWPNPRERIVPGRRCGLEVAAISLQVLGGEETCPPQPKSGNPRVHWKDPLLDGVYQHPKILSGSMISHI